MLHVDHCLTFSATCNVVLSVGDVKHAILSETCSTVALPHVTGP